MYTMEDFQRKYAKEHFAKLTLEEKREALASVPPEEILSVLSPEQIRQIRGQLPESRPAQPRKPRKKK